MNRSRNKTLVVVEGKHEKEKLIKLLLQCFPEIPIEYDDVNVFGADIYDFYKSIEDEYGEKWFDEDIVIDVPYLISKRNGIEPQLQRRNFTNILLVFDYERQDPGFSQEKLERLQRHFWNVSDDGLLYINYPMIESYLDMQSVPESGFMNKKIPSNLTPGSMYKNMAKEKSVLLKFISTYENICMKIAKLLSRCSEADKEDVRFSIFSIDSDENLELSIANILAGYDISDALVNKSKYAIAAQLRNLNYLQEGVNFWAKLRGILFYVSTENLRKTGMIQNIPSDIYRHDLQAVYENLNFAKLLEVQGICSSDIQKGFIWVVCTFITFLGEYKFYWKNNEVF